MSRQKNYADAASDQVAAQKARQKRVDYAATHSPAELFKHFNTSQQGLNDSQVAQSRKLFGANHVQQQHQPSIGKRLISAFVNPFTAILLILAIVSTFTDMIFPYFSLFGSRPENFTCATVVIIVTMIMLSGLLRFVQEYRSGNATAKLLAMIKTTCTVTRNGQEEDIDLNDVVVGDIVHLSAGNMIPADLRILENTDLFVNRSELTGESRPVEKSAADETPKAQITDYENIALMGSNVISGSGLGLVIEVGSDTMFGSMAGAVAKEKVTTNFTKGVNSVSWVLIRFMMVMVPLVFLINGLTKHDWLEAFLFGISTAVGLTPEMLPMIVTTCLAKGAIAMSRKKTIVKNLNSIQDFGAADILCTDKTGTLTQDKIVLDCYWNIDGQADDRVLRHAFLNSYFQTGYKNVMDKAIIAKAEDTESHPELQDLENDYVKIDEIPFDFKRRRLSIVVKDPNGKRQMVTKGAVEEMLSVCSYAETKTGIQPLNDALQKQVKATVDRLNDKGFRVLILSQKTDPAPIDVLSAKDEKDMVLMGYLAFLDPPKESTGRALKALLEHGVTTKILTGDNDKVTATVCQEVGMSVAHLLLGEEIVKMSDQELAAQVEQTQVFAKLTPDQKARIVTALRAKGHTVAYMGDGINDAEAMKTADIGISVDNAVDVAKESADIILLQKDLMILERGIVEGRKTYANMIKYIKMTASSNFGNIFSVLIAAALLPFLPMKSIHLLLLNLIYDCCCTAIPWDNVDADYLKVPREWDASSIGSFMIWMGPTSSVFDLTTYLFMYFIFCPLFVSHGILYPDLPAHFSGAVLAAMQLKYVGMFQAGWFVESMWSQTMVIHMIRTPKIPFIQSRASAELILLSTIGIALATLIPFTAVGRAIGFVALPDSYFWYLIPCVICYMLLATSIKKAYIRHFGELL